MVEVAAGGEDVAAGSAADAVDGPDVLDHRGRGPVGPGLAGERPPGADADGQGGPDRAGAGEDLAGVGGGDPAVAGQLAGSVGLAGGDLERDDDPGQRRRLTRALARPLRGTFTGHGSGRGLRVAGGAEEGVGGEVGAELVEAAGVPAAAGGAGLGVEPVQDRRDRRGVRGHGQGAHPVLGEPPEDPAPGPRLPPPLLAPACVDRGDRAAQPTRERAVRHRLPVPGRREHRLLHGGHVRVGQLRGLGGDEQCTVQRGRPGTQRRQDDPVPARCRGETEPAGDLTGADPGRQGDLLGHDPVGRHVQRPSGKGQRLDLLRLDRVQRAVGGEQPRLQPCLLRLELPDGGQRPLAHRRQAALHVSHSGRAHVLVLDTEQTRSAGRNIRHRTAPLDITDTPMRTYVRTTLKGRVLSVDNEFGSPAAQSDQRRSVSTDGRVSRRVRE